jgi:HEPN domain-containing protein
MRSTLARGSWNRTVRKAQQVVELAIRAALLDAGADYPRVHDVGPRLERVAREHPLGLSEADASRISAISAELARLRAPVFYAERDCSEHEARDAAAQAEEVFALLVPSTT